MNLSLKREYFNDLASRWDQLPAPPGAAASVERFVEAAVDRSARLILDAGCGTGILLPPLRRLAPECRVVEMDVAEQMLAESRKKEASARIVQVCGDARRPPFASGAFDAVLCFGVLPHLAPIEEALRNLLACLRPGGLLSVGHLMGSEALNALHASLGPAVAGDRLPSSERLAALLTGLGAEVARREEAPDRYLVQARRQA